MKILVIEDDADVRSGIERMLVEHGFQVDAVDTGEVGYYRALNWEYDAIVLDVMLPEMDGWKLLRKLREHRATPVIMLTALGELEDRVRGLDGGADDFLVKPFEAQELLARLRAVSRRSAGHSKNVLELDRVRIDTGAQEVMLDDEVVDLTGAQYRILLYLAMRVGTIVSRAEIQDAVSSDDNENWSNVLDVQIHNIRKKLGKDFIENRRGLGYTIPRRVRVGG